MPIARPGRARPLPVGRSPVRSVRVLAAAAAGLGLILGSLFVPAAFAAASSHVSISSADATVIDPRGFPAKAAAYLTSGGCPPTGGAEPTTLPDGDWTFGVTTADGATLLSSDAAGQRGFQVSGGLIVATTGAHDAPFRACPNDPTSGSNRPRTIALTPFGDAPAGGAYRLVVAATSAVESCLAGGDATGFGCVGLPVWTADFTIAGSRATSTSASPSPTVTSIGRSVVDQAAVTGSAGSPTGTLVFYVCPGATCASGGTLVGAVDVTAGGGTSPGFTAPSDGTWTFRAEYWGDVDNAPSSSAGGGQTFTVGAGSTPTPTPSTSAGASPATSAGATGGPSTSPSGGGTATSTPTGAASGTPRPTTTPRPTVTPTPGPQTGPILTGTPPPPTKRPTVTPTPRASVNLGPCGDGRPVCYLVSPTFFGPGWSQGGAGSTATSTATPAKAPNGAAESAYGAGGVPHFPGLNAPSSGGSQGGGGGAGGGGAGGGGTTSGGAAPGQASGAVPSADGSVAGASSVATPSASGTESSATLTADGSVVPTQPPNAQGVGAGPTGVGVSTLPAEAAGAILSPGASDSTTQQPAPAPQSANAIAVVVVGLLVLGIAVAGWVLRLRRPRGANRG